MFKKNRGKNRLATNAIIYIFGSFFVQGLRFITLPFFSRWMPAADYALMSSYEAWISIISIFVGLQVTSTLGNAYWDFGNESIKKYISHISLIGIFSGLIIAGLTLIFAPFLKQIFEIDESVLLLGVLQCVFTFYLSLLVTKYRITEQPWYYLSFSILNSAINIILGMFLVWYLPQNKYIGRVYSSVIAALLTGGVAAILIYRERPQIFNRVYTLYALKLSIPIIFHSLGGIILGKADQIMLLNLAGKQIMGIYSYGTNFAHIIYVLCNSCNMAYGPYYYKLKQRSENKRIVEINIIYIRIFLMLSGSLVLLLPEIIKIMSGEEYYQALYSVSLLAAGFMVNFLYTFPVNYEFYCKKTKYIAVATLLTTVLNIILNSILIPEYKEIGAATATLISTFLQFIFHYCTAKYIIGNYEMQISRFTGGLIFILTILVIYHLCLDKPWIRGILSLGLCGLSAVEMKKGLRYEV